MLYSSISKMSRETFPHPHTDELTAASGRAMREQAVAGVDAGGCEWPPRVPQPPACLSDHTEWLIDSPNLPADLREVARFDKVRGVIAEAQAQAESDSERAKYSKLLELADEVEYGKPKN